MFLAWRLLKNQPVKSVPRGYKSGQDPPEKYWTLDIDKEIYIPNSSDRTSPLIHNFPQPLFTFQKSSQCQVILVKIANMIVDDSHVGQTGTSMTTRTGNKGTHSRYHQGHTQVYSPPRNFLVRSTDSAVDPGSMYDSHQASSPYAGPPSPPTILPPGARAHSISRYMPQPPFPESSGTHPMAAQPQGSYGMYYPQDTYNPAFQQYDSRLQPYEYQTQPFDTMSAPTQQPQAVIQHPAPMPTE